MTNMTRREAIKFAGAAGIGVACGEAIPAVAAGTARPVGVLRIGLLADPHLSTFWETGPQENRTPRIAKNLIAFVERMHEFKADFVVAIGDYVTPRGRKHGNTPEQYAGFKEDLGVFWPILKAVPCPAYVVAGNHDVGWIRGGDEKVTTAELIAKGKTGGHALCKDEWCQILGMPGRYYAFDAGDFRCLVLDGNNTQDTDADNAKDGLRGAYWIDQSQLEWIRLELSAHRDKPKIIFSHEELHHTDHFTGSGQGGWTPLPPHYKDGSYIGNGWQVRELFEQDGKVAVVFHGHYHKNRWTVYGGTHYITLDDLGTLRWLWADPAPEPNMPHWAEVTISGDRMHIAGHGNQMGFDLPTLPADARPVRPPKAIYTKAIHERELYQKLRLSKG